MADFFPQGSVCLSVLYDIRPFLTLNFLSILLLPYSHPCLHGLVCHLSAGGPLTEELNVSPS